MQCLSSPSNKLHMDMDGHASKSQTPIVLLIGIVPKIAILHVSGSGMVDMGALYMVYTRSAGMALPKTQLETGVAIMAHL